MCSREQAWYSCDILHEDLTVPHPDAEQEYARGCALDEAGDDDAALACFELAHALDPSWFAPPFALGVMCKWLLRFEDCLRWSELAGTIDPTHDGAEWNAGIAATALGLHRRARRAWKRFIPTVDESDEPLEMDFGLVPIRLDPRGAGEVVWARRVNPAIAILVSIPFDESGFGHGDRVLHDGEPRGHRMLRGQQVPVFDALTCLEPSPYSTYLATLPSPTDETMALLRRLAEERRVPLEDWTTNVRFLCRACSLGEPHETHDHDGAPPDGERLVALAAETDDPIAELLDTFTTELGLPELEVEVRLDRRVEA